MYKIQYIKLLELRGITKLEGKTIGDVIRQTGGEPNEKEMIKVNEECMNHYLQKYEEEVSKNKELTNQIEILKNVIENNKNIIEKSHSESGKKENHKKFAQTNLVNKSN
jgi:predicted RNase H-like nuclease (RuvC/YqgF family)